MDIFDKIEKDINKVAGLKKSERIDKLNVVSEKLKAYASTLQEMWADLDNEIKESRMGSGYDSKETLARLDKIVEALVNLKATSATAVKIPAPNVSVKAPDVRLFPEIKVPAINVPKSNVTVTMPKMAMITKWKFTIIRDRKIGLINEIIAEKFE